MSDLPQLAVGGRAPDIALPDLSGCIVSLTGVREAGHVVIHFVREFS